MANKVILVGSVCMLAAVVGAVVIGSALSSNGEESSKGEGGGGGGGGGGSGLSTSTKAVQSVCQPTTYRDTCVNTLSSAAGNTSDPRELIRIAFEVAKREITKGIEKSKTIQAAKNDPRCAKALEICREVVEYSVSDLERSVDSLGRVSSDTQMDRFLEDLKVWMGGAITYQDVCFDAFENTTDTEPGMKMRQFFNISRQLTSNALAMMDEVKEFASLLDLKSLGLDGGSSTGSGSGGSSGGSSHRRLLLGKNPPEPVQLAGELPPWISDPQRKILNQPTSSIKPDVVVALDGSTKMKHINGALNLVPKDNVKPFIIYIKAGIYKEHVTVDKKKANVIFIGDGPTKTIITGNRSFKDGWPTFKTATVGVMSDGFMAKDIGFENSAGAEGHQAVAIRVVGDYSIFLNCRFDGYQDTLYAVRSRQFYRDCTITGTIDFVFGDAQVVFQNCELVVRKPLDNQQCMVTAQGRSDPNGPGVTVLHNCTISGDKEYMPVKQTNPAFLGRPWKEYSRTIVMQSFIGDAISPEGWTPWAGNFGLNTLFYSEYENRGPRADLSARVKWPGIKTLNEKQIEHFTPEKLFKGSTWITPAGAPYAAGFLKV